MVGKTNLITLEGYDVMVALLSSLKKEKEYWVKEKQIAAAQGDRSENAEYISAKENIRNIDRRLFRLANHLETSTAVDVTERKKVGMVLFGDKVSLLKSEGGAESELIVKIIGTNELEYMKNQENFIYISNISPLGKRLLKKEAGDVVSVNGLDYEILEKL